MKKVTDPADQKSMDPTGSGSLSLHHGDKNRFFLYVISGQFWPKLRLRTLVLKYQSKCHNHMSGVSLVQ